MRRHERAQARCDDPFHMPQQGQRRYGGNADTELLKLAHSVQCTQRTDNSVDCGKFALGDDGGCNPADVWVELEAWRSRRPWWRARGPVGLRLHGCGRALVQSSPSSTANYFLAQGGENLWTPLKNTDLRLWWRAANAAIRSQLQQTGRRARSLGAHRAVPAAPPNATPTRAPLVDIGRLFSRPSLARCQVKRANPSLPPCEVAYGF